MTIDNIPKEIIVLEYLQIVNHGGTTTKDIKENLDKSYLKALNRLYNKFGAEIDVKIDPKCWKHTYFINDNGRENLETWKEHNEQLAKELEGIYFGKYFEEFVDESAHEIYIVKFLESLIDAPKN
jgi:DNA-binding PadR family transcriptional regulator